jgi:hypothetical protein
LGRKWVPAFREASDDGEARLSLVRNHMRCAIFPHCSARRDKRLGKTKLAIILQSTGGGFSDAFMRELPLLEQTMIARGLDPSQFVISKDRATPAFFGDEHFTVTEPNDMLFLDYLRQRCIAAGEAPQRPRWLLPRPIRRFLRCMARPI